MDELNCPRSDAEPDLESTGDIVERIRAKAAASTGREADVFDLEQERRDATRVDDVLRGWGVPKRVRLTLDRPQTTKAIDIVQAWLDAGENAWCLVLSADKGVGKSTAAGWWLRKTAAEAQPSTNAFRRWWPAAEIAAMDFYGDDFKRLCDCHSLVLDDLGAEYSDAKGAFQSKLDRVMDARYREYRRTIVTTNLSVKGFVERYDTRIYDRMREGGVWQGISGASMRAAQ